MTEEVIADLQREAAVKNAKPRPIAIVGSAPSTRHHTPGNDDKVFQVPSPHVLGGHGSIFLPEWEVWAVGTVDQLERWDVFFDLHDFNTYGPEYKAYLKWISEQTKPIVVARPDPRVRNAIIYPLDQVIRRFRTFFGTSTVAWMMALAIVMKAPKIGIFGIDMGDTVEYRAQRAGCKAFWLIAEALGIEVVIPPGSDLLYEPVPYPFILEDPLMQKLAKRNLELTERRAHHQTRDRQLGEHVLAVQQEQASHRSIGLKLEGAIEALEIIGTNWTWKGFDPRAPSGLPHISEIMKIPLPPAPVAVLPITQPPAPMSPLPETPTQPKT